MDSYALHLEVEAPELESAVSIALSRLDCTRADVDISVLQTQSRGLLGLFGAQPARVSVRITDRALIARQFALRLLSLSGFEARLEVSQSSQQIDLVFCSDQQALIIGRHGQTLEALQTLITTMTDRQTTDRTPIQCDIDGYRARRLDVINDLANRLIRQVRKTRKPASSPVLPSSERRILHDLFRAEPDLLSSSQRQDGQRKFVVVQLQG